MRVFRFLVFCATLLGAVTGVQSAPPKPNILLIVADDLGYADVGFNGGSTIRTPNLDRFASAGVKLTDFRSCPMCSPTRAGLLTGRWPLRFGMMRAVVPPWSTNGLPGSESTLPELLAKAGYDQRGIIGKWHLGHARNEMLPPAQGFTSFYGHYNGAIDYFDHTREGETDWHRNSKTIKEPGYSTDLLGAEAVHFIESASTTKPWFLYLPFNAPHSPFQAKPEDLEKYKNLQIPDRRAYAAMVDSMDQAIGKVLGAVDKRSDASNTLVLFFSDNGGISRVGSNSPWRGEKLTVYEGGTRVCAAIRWQAGGLQGGGSFDGRIGYIDVLPTLLAVAGVKPPGNLDGINFLPALKGAAFLPERQWFSYIHQNQDAHASVHEGPWKLVAHGDFFADSPAQGPRLELYNLRDDPKESRDLAPANPETTSRLQRALREFGKLQQPGGTLYHVGREGFKAPKDWVVGD
jgi:arylsulfatase A-like enzyme